MERRPTVLVVEPNNPDGLSTRKLVLETGKFNVLTAHSVAEAHVALDDFPGIDVMVLHSGVTDGPLQELAGRARQQIPDLELVSVSPEGKYLSGVPGPSFTPTDAYGLLDVLVEKFGDPKKEIATVKPTDDRRTA